MTSYDTWKTTEPDPFAHEPVGECHWCGHRTVLYRTWLHPIEAWLCADCSDESAGWNEVEEWAEMADRGETRD